MARKIPVNATKRPAVARRHYDRPGGAGPSYAFATGSGQRHQLSVEFLARCRQRGLPDAHRVMPAAAEDDWEATAVDITRLDKTDPMDCRRINNAWRALKRDAPREAADLATFFPRLRAAFPGAGIEVPAATLE